MDSTDLDLLEIFPSLSTEIDHWINHDQWYTTQCIDHYDRQVSVPLELQPLTDEETLGINPASLQEDLSNSFGSEASQHSVLSSSFSRSQQSEVSPYEANQSETSSFLSNQSVAIGADRSVSASFENNQTVSSPLQSNPTFTSPFKTNTPVSIQVPISQSPQQDPGNLYGTASQESSPKLQLQFCEPTVPQQPLPTTSARTQASELIKLLQPTIKEIVVNNSSQQQGTTKVNNLISKDIPTIFIVTRDQLSNESTGNVKGQTNATAQSPTSRGSPKATQANSFFKPESSDKQTQSGESSPSAGLKKPFVDEDLLKYLQSDEGVTTFAKAQHVPKEELVQFLEHGNWRENANLCHSSDENENKAEEELHKRRRRHRGSYSKKTCLEVIEFVKKGYSARAAAKRFGIPKSTVHNWLHEDIASRPDTGHRKRGFSEPHEDGYFLEQPKLGTSDVKTEQTAQSLIFVPKEQNEFPVSPNLVPSSSNNACTDNNMKDSKLTITKHEEGPTVNDTKVKVERIERFDDERPENMDLEVNFDELLRINDWIEHDQWYQNQYHNHYNVPQNNRHCYASYSNEERRLATEYVKEGQSLASAAKKFGIPKSTIYTWLTEGNSPHALPCDVENAVVEQIHKLHENETPLTLTLVKRAAQEVATPRVDHFKPSFAWCRDFLKRHHLDTFEHGAPHSKKVKIEDSKERATCTENGVRPTMSDLATVLGLTSTSQVQTSQEENEAPNR